MIPALNMTPPNPRFMIFSLYSVDNIFELFEKFELSNCMVLPKKTMQLP